MSKKEAIVDTCFFNKLSNDGKNIEAFKKVLVDLDYKPVVHPYIAEKELDVFPHFNKLVEEGFIRKAVMRLPIILSEDGDIEFLRSVAKRKISSDSYNLDIYNVMDLIMMIAKKEDTTFSKKELGKVVLEVKERARLSEVKQVWNETHSNA